MAHYRAGQGIDFTAAYTWSHATGDLNTLSDTLVPFGAPVIRPDVAGVLPTDVPQRFLVSGQFPLPWQFFISPVVDVRSGLPYSPLDVLQNYVGTPDGSRYPNYFSMDVRIYRVFRIPFTERSKNRRMRLGVYSTDVTGHQNPNAVYSVVASPSFGQFAGFQKRIDGLVIDLVP